MEITDDEELNYSPQAPRDTVLPGDCAGLRFDQALARMFPEYSRSQLQQWIEAGRATLDARTAEPKRRVTGGERIVLVPAPTREETAFAPEALPLPIIHEDAAILVIDKPAGLVVHPGSGNWSGTLLNALLAHVPAAAGLPRAGIVHRLDKDTSGLMVVAKTPESQTALVRQLQARTVTRVYLAAVHGNVRAEGTVDAPIGRHPVQRTRMAIVAGGREARTRYRPLGGGAGWTLVECRLDTGRTHQIRVHLQSIGHPLLGDPVYGSREIPPRVRTAVGAFERQALHACELSLDHPVTGERQRWQAPPPADFEALIARLGQALP